MIAGHARERRATPCWGTKPFTKTDRTDRWVVLASGYDDDGALPIRAHARVLGATLGADGRISYPLGATQKGYLVAAYGVIEIDGIKVNGRDGVAISDTESLHITAIEKSEIILVQTA